MKPPRSPFPGMDPYLEAPALWPGFHDSLITYLRDDLQPLLPEPYYADIQDRIYVSGADRWIVPPVASSTSSAIVIELPEIEVREPFVEIRDSRSGDRVVTVVEILSPENKRPGTEGADRYRAKQREVLRSSMHLVEIDMLRSGQAPLARLESCPPWHYLVVVRRADRPTQRDVYPAHLRQQLPIVQIPLRPPDSDVAIDLQALVERAYERGAYHKRLDYSVAPVPPIEAVDDPRG